MNKMFPATLLAGIMLLPSCALLEAPRLGTVSAGMYHDAEARFSCPIPGRAEGFGAEVVIDDAIRPTRREFDFKVNHEVDVFDGYRPALHVKFTDAANPSSRIQVRMEILGQHDLADFKQKHKSSNLYQRHFHGGNYGYLGETALPTATPYTTIGVVQFPYWDPRQSYMGTNLAAAYHNGDTSMGPIEVIGLANFILLADEAGNYRHYHIAFSQDARNFLPPGVDARDIEAVFQAMQRHPEVVPRVRTTLSDFLQRCNWPDINAASPASSR